MAKSKRGGPALFELLQGNRFRRDDPEVQTHLRVVHHEPESTEDSDVGSDGDGGAIRAEKSTLVQVKEDRLHLALTPLSAAAIVFVLSVVVLGVYLVGRQRGENSAVLQGIAQGDAATADSVEAARMQPPAPHLVESLIEGSSKAPPAKNREAQRPATRNAEPAVATPAADVELPPGPRHGWVRDYTYIVAQEFGAARMDDARAAQHYLASRGFPAEIVKLDSGPLQLITLDGYNHKDAAQKKKADEVLKRQRAAGVEYFATGGGYKLEGYYKTLKKDQW